MNKFILEAENINFSYSKKPFISNLSFSIKKGELISILGENGSGKTTLLHILNGDFKPDSGKIFFNSKDISKISLREKAKKITTVYQNINTDFPFSCFEIAAMGLYPHKNFFENITKNDVDFIMEIMKMTLTDSFCSKKLTELSGGERQRVILAKALIQKPELLFLDEAMSNLDISSKINMTSLLKKICEEKGITIIMICHDLSTAFEYSDKIIAMKNGKLLYFDETKNLINKNFFKSVFGVNADIYDDKRFFIYA